MMMGRKVTWLCLWFLFIAICFSAQASEWTLVGESNRGWVNQLVVPKSDPNVLYAGMEGAGFLVSTDKGATWVAKNEGLTEAAEGTVSGYHVRCIAVDPTNPDIIYIGMAAFGVFKSNNGGDIWEPTNESLGDTFTKTIAIHPLKPDKVYLGTDGGGVYRYDVKASKWEEIIEGLRNTYIKAMVMDPQDLNVIYVGSDGGVSKTTDGGDNWSQASNGMTSRYVLCLAIDPGSPNILYAGTDSGGLFKTEDGGDNWTAIGGDIWMVKPTDDIIVASPQGEPLPVVSAVVVNPENTAIVYAANQSGVFRSADGGNTWAQINTGLTNTIIKSLAISLTKPVTVYAGTVDGKLFGYTEE